MNAHADLLLGCFQAASDAAKLALERSMARVIAELQTREIHCMDVAERDELGSNLRYLQARKTDWPARYAASLLLELSQSLSHDEAVDNPAPAARPKLAVVGLVDEADMVQVIRGQRLLQDLLPTSLRRRTSPSWC